MTAFVSADGSKLPSQILVNASFVDLKGIKSMIRQLGKAKYFMSITDCGEQNQKIFREYPMFCSYLNRID